MTFRATSDRPERDGLWVGTGAVTGSHTLRPFRSFHGVPAQPWGTDE
jgi:hypothetical protein